MSRVNELRDIIVVLEGGTCREFELVKTEAFQTAVAEGVSRVVAPMIVKAIVDAVGEEYSQQKEWVSPTLRRVTEVIDDLKITKEEAEILHQAAAQRAEERKGERKPALKKALVEVDAVPGPSGLQKRSGPTRRVTLQEPLETVTEGETDEEQFTAVRPRRSRKKKKSGGDQKDGAQTGGGKTTFADILRRVPSQVPVSIEKTATYVTVKGRVEEGEWSPKRIFEQFPTREEMKEVGPGVEMVKVTNKGAILFKAEGTKEATKLLSWEKLRERGLEVKLASTRRPRVEVKGVPVHWDAPTLERYLWGKVPSICEEKDRREWMRPCYSTLVPRTVTKRWVLETHPVMRMALLSLKPEDVSEGWWGLMMSDCLDPMLCLRCQKYGHPARVCTAETACRWCGLDGHKASDCPQKKKGIPPRCAHCCKMGTAEKESRHLIGSKECPVHLQEMSLLMKKTRYA